ncbi:MAG: hypothetical protein JWM95_4428, partial [Gemmatimonadetes bacterium]|nr:hypothetical protein [Gemmatimonadota bacterium]
MSETPHPHSSAAPATLKDDVDLDARVTSAIALLEAIARDRDQLLDVDEAQRNRLLRAAGEVSRPDAITRRQLVKATKRVKKAERRERLMEAEVRLTETGIRQLRKQTVFTTPNYFLPSDLPDDGVDEHVEERDQIESRHCYVCKQQCDVLH